MIITTVLVDITDRKAVEVAVDRDLEGFDMWFRHVVGDGPVTSFEKAILKSYLYYKLYGAESAIQKAERDSEDGARERGEPPSSRP